MNTPLSLGYLSQVNAPPFFVWAILLAIVAGLGAAFFLLMSHKKEGAEGSVAEITGFIEDCASLYLKSQYALIAKVILLFSGLMFLGSFLGHFNHFFGVAALSGGLWAAAIGYFTLKFSISLAAKIVAKTQGNAAAGGAMLFSAGGMMVVLCAAIALADMVAWVLVLNFVFDHNVFNLAMHIVRKVGMFQEWTPEMAASPAFIRFKFEEISLILLSYTVGASLYALISRIGGGVLRQSTHAATDAAFAQTEVTLPDDDIRNPGIMADLIGRNANGIAGSLAGLYQLVAIGLALTMYLGAFLLETMTIAAGTRVFLLPFLVLSIGLVSALVGFGYLSRTRTSDTMSDQRIRRGQGLTAGVGMLLCLGLLIASPVESGFVFAAMVGIVASTVVGLGIQRFTTLHGRQIRAVIDAGRSGFGAMLLKGIELGFTCALIPIVTTLGALGLAYILGDGGHSLVTGMYAVMICALASIGNGLYMQGLATSEPIASTGLALARMLQDDPTAAHLSTLESSTTSARAAADAGFCMALTLIVATTITAILISIKHWIHKLAGIDGISIGNTYFANHPLYAYPHACIITDIPIFDLADKLGISMINPQFIAGLILGLGTIIWIAGYAIRRSNTSAAQLADMIRVEFTENPDITTGATLPNYGDSISFSTVFSQKSVLPPVCFACTSVVLATLILGIAGSIGHLFGALMGLLVITLTAGSAASFWKNAYTRLKHTPDSLNATRISLKTLGSAGALIPDCVGPVLNTVMVLMISLAMLLGLVGLKFGHILVL